MARFPFQALSKDPEEWVEILVDENSEESEVVRVKFRKLPDPEFELLQSLFISALNSFSRLSEEVSKSEAKVLEGRVLNGRGTEQAIQEHKRTVQGYRDAKAALQAIRREIVQKTVIDHRAEDFQLDHLPFKDDTFAGEAMQLLFKLGFSEEEIQKSFEAGYLQVPFKPSTWIYNEGSSDVTLPGASEETVRHYEKLRPNSLLLTSICNAVFYWHRFELKPANQRKTLLKEARLSRKLRLEKIQLLLESGYIKAPHVEDLLSLPQEIFDVLVKLLLEARELLFKKTE